MASPLPPGAPSCPSVLDCFLLGYLQVQARDYVAGGPSLRGKRGPVVFELRRGACWSLGRAGVVDLLPPPGLGTWQDLGSAWGILPGGSLVSDGLPAHLRALGAGPDLQKPHFRDHRVRAKLGPAWQPRVGALAFCSWGLEVLKLRSILSPRRLRHMLPDTSFPYEVTWPPCATPSREQRQVTVCWT